MGFRTMTSWTYYEKYMVDSYGNGANYALYYIDPNGVLNTDVAYLQRDLHVAEFEQLLDACTNEQDFADLWQRYFYDELPTDYEVLIDRLLEQTEYEEEPHWSDTDCCSDHCDSCGGEYYQTMRNGEYVTGPFTVNGKCVCQFCANGE